MIENRMKQEIDVKGAANGGSRKDLGRQKGDTGVGASANHGEKAEAVSEVDASEKAKPRKRRTKKQAAEPEEQILPNLSTTGMSEAWQAFYRAVAKEMKK
jgi:hypothetical protein